MKLSDFDHLRSDKRIKFKEEIVKGRSFTIISYMIADTSLWQNLYALETRGITFDTLTGECVCRPFEKFFNLNENAWTQSNDIDFDGMTVLDKRDGSMIMPVIIDGEIVFKTKKSFFSDVAIKSNEKIPDWVDAVCRSCVADNFTPIFEFTSPDHQIVIGYGQKETYRLLAVRDNDSGEYLDYSVQKACFPYALHIDKVSLSINQINESVDSLKGVEGFVLCLKDGRRVKIKTRWYIENHRIMTDLRERDVAKMVINENLDDLKSTLVAEGKPLDPVEQIEKRVSSQLASIVKVADELLAKIKQEPDRKSAAIRYSNHPSFGVAMVMYSGAEPDWKKIWTKLFLDNYSLRVIYNPTFGETE